jgi:hypothetical protein
MVWKLNYYVLYKYYVPEIMLCNYFIHLSNDLCEVDIITPIFQMN